MLTAARRYAREVHASHVRLGFLSGNCPFCARVRREERRDPARADRRRNRFALPGEPAGRRADDHRTEGGRMH